MEKDNELTSQELQTVIDLILVAKKLYKNLDDLTLINGAWLKLTREYMKMEMMDSRDNERDI